MIKEKLCDEGLSAPTCDTQSDVYLLSVDSISDLHCTSLDIEAPDGQDVPAPTTPSTLPPVPAKVQSSEEQNQVLAQSGCPLGRCGPTFYCFSASALLGILVLTCLATLGLILHLCVNLATVTRSMSHRLEAQEEALRMLQHSASSLTSSKHQ
ncbi:uncharacterized protein O3C94_013251 [Discoglossus pictus]